MIKIEFPIFRRFVRTKEKPMNEQDSKRFTGSLKMTNQNAQPNH